ncbi:MAG TPA: NAD(P)-binding protein, partial [Steroidobacteraceae bacterium]|nr:NAD(P)-binding protein [Steroidobacteraceae bacterium]
MTCVSPHGRISPGCTGLWSEEQRDAWRRIVDFVHGHTQAKLCLQLGHSGRKGSTQLGWEQADYPLPSDNWPIISASPLPYYPHSQIPRAMTRADMDKVIADFVQAVQRGDRAGFDMAELHCAHGYLLASFISPLTNQRTDEYGGSLENRVRMLRELISDTKEAVGDKCAVAVRFATEEFLGVDGVRESEAREIVHLLADLPDLWDVNIAAWHMDSQTSRFAGEGYQEPFTGWVKSITRKPVVGVGRFTSPDTMVGQIRRGVLDFIGAARPSIADPFLPRKIEEGRVEDIRECIGCNICVTGDMTSTPIRCTQNPTMGEEWRKGWHPERIAPSKSSKRVLVVGAGPAGLEAARALGQRGYEVHLAEASRELGGRVNFEARLPGLAQWARVRDWRVTQLQK